MDRTFGGRSWNSELCARVSSSSSPRGIGEVARVDSFRNRRRSAGVVRVRRIGHVFVALGVRLRWIPHLSLLGRLLQDAYRVRSPQSLFRDPAGSEEPRVPLVTASRARRIFMYAASRHKLAGISVIVGRAGLR